MRRDRGQEWESTTQDEPGCVADSPRRLFAIKKNAIFNAPIIMHQLASPPWVAVKRAL